MKQYATYLRVSTQKQGQTQLGLTSQRSMCEGFIKEHNGELGKEFLDVESGTHRDRKGLWGAINYCQKNNCPLVIATLSRLARDVEFCFKVINTGIEIHFVDMPQINTLLLGVFASVAQYERELTSDRTKKALAVKKAQGCKMGASNELYRINYKEKTESEKKSMHKTKGIAKTKNHHESKDVQAFIKVLQKEFSFCSDVPTEWNWGVVNCKMVHLNSMLERMQEYRSLDNDLFKKWDFASDGVGQRLRSYVQSFKKSYGVA